MQKKIIAMAIAGLASTGAFAQMNVTVYGQIDLSINHLSGTSLQASKNAETGAANATSNSGAGNASVTQANGGQTSMASGRYRGSYLGFKGTEDLGGGMKMDFVVESTINADGDSNGRGGQVAPSASTTDGAGLLGDSQATLGLTTGVGKFTFGRMSNMLATLAAGADPFFGKGPGGVEQLAIIPITSTKLNNSIRYDIAASGFFGGYQFGMSEAQDKVAQNSSGGSVSNIWVGYKDGPALFMVGQNVMRDYQGASIGVASALGLGAGTQASYLVQGRKFTANVAAGTYDFGMLKLHGMYSTMASSGPACNEYQQTLAGAFAGVSAVCTVARQNLKAIDARTWLLGLTVPFGAHSVKVSYVNTDDKRTADMDANSWGLGYEYDFSKRTKLYSRYATVKNSNGAPFGVVIGGGQLVSDSIAIGAGSGTSTAAFVATSATQRTNGWNVGLQHSF